MADANLHCKTCGETTGHMHLGGRTCICSICGEQTHVKNWKQIAAEVDERKRANQAAVAGRQAPAPEIKAAPAETKPAQTEPTPARPDTEPADSEIEQIKKEIAMNKKLTDQDKADIARRYGEGVTVTTLATDFGVSGQRIRTAIKRGKAQRGRKPGRVAKAHTKAQPTHSVEAGGGFRALLERMVDERINARLAGLGLESLDRKVAEIVKAELAEALK